MDEVTFIHLSGPVNYSTRTEQTSRFFPLENGRSWQLADAVLDPSHPEQEGRQSTLARSGHVLLEDGVLENIWGDERRLSERRRRR